MLEWQASRGSDTSCVEGGGGDAPCDSCLQPSHLHCENVLDILPPSTQLFNIRPLSASPAACNHSDFSTYFLFLCHRNLITMLSSKGFWRSWAVSGFLCLEPRQRSDHSAWLSVTQLEVCRLSSPGNRFFSYEMGTM